MTRWQMLAGVAFVLVSGASLWGQTQEIQDELNAKLAEMRKLQGTWVMESATFKGKPFEQASKNMKLVFDKDTLTTLAKGEDGKEQGTPKKYELDVKKDRILLTTRGISVDKNGKESPYAQHAVYELKGDVLNFYAAGPGRPAVASLKEASENWPLLRFKRVK